MIKRMVIVRGLPGSGKDYLTIEWKKKYKDSAFICSTDDYWLRPDGRYDFNVEIVGHSHVWNQKRAEAVLQKDQKSQYDSIVIINNTNITFHEIFPYAKIAKKYNFPLFIIEPDTKWKYDVEECFRLNGHGVPYATILRMYHNWDSTDEVKRRLRSLDYVVLDSLV